MNIPAVIHTLSEGKLAPVSVSLIWGIHEGIRGASWMVVNSDGIVTELLYMPSPDFSQPLPEKQLGRISIQEAQALAAVVIEAKTDLIQPRPDTNPDPGTPQVELTVIAGEDQKSHFL